MASEGEQPLQLFAADFPRHSFLLQFRLRRSQFFLQPFLLPLAGCPLLAEGVLLLDELLASAHCLCTFLVQCYQFAAAAAFVPQFAHLLGQGLQLLVGVRAQLVSGVFSLAVREEQ